MPEDNVSTNSVPIQSESVIIAIYDPPMCCPTGLCGPALDETLLSVNEMMLTLQDAGVTFKRYQMTSHPQAFLSHAAVMKLVQKEQMAALPITTVNDRIVKVGAYPTLEEMRAVLAEEHSAV
jgi:hypothetical protein